MLASASDAVIVGFQVRPSADARKAADREGVEINTYSCLLYTSKNQEIDPELEKTFDKLGIPLEERLALSGTAVDAIMDLSLIHI